MPSKASYWPTMGNLLGILATGPQERKRSLMPSALANMSLELASVSDFYAKGGNLTDVFEEVYARLDRHAECGAWTYIVQKDNVLAQAARLSGRKASTDLPLFGVPFSVKDNIDVAGIPTTASCPAYSYIPTTSATIVERMQAAGAILIGKNTMDQFCSIGAQVVEVDLELFQEAGQMVFSGPLLVERMASVGRFIAEHRPETHPVVADIIESAASFKATDLIEAQHRLKFLQAEAERIMSGIDVLAVPTTVGIPTIVAVEADPVAANARMGRYTYFANPLGLCGVAVPASLRPDGLPFGICLYARKRADVALLSVASVFQRATGLRPGRH